MSEKNQPGTILSNALSSLLTVTGLDINVPNKVVRLSPSQIRKLREVSTNMGQWMIDRIFDTSEAGISGDMFAVTTVDVNGNSWLVLVMERGSDYNAKKNGIHMAQTTFALSSVGIGDLVLEQIHADYGKDSNGKYLRYTSPTDYELSRGNISTDLVYDMNVGLQDNPLSCVFDLLNKGASYAMRTI